MRVRAPPLSAFRSSPQAGKGCLRLPPSIGALKVAESERAGSMLSLAVCYAAAITEPVAEAHPVPPVKWSLHPGTDQAATVHTAGRTCTRKRVHLETRASQQTPSVPALRPLGLSSDTGGRSSHASGQDTGPTCPSTGNACSCRETRQSSLHRPGHGATLHDLKVLTQGIRRKMHRRGRKHGVF